MRSGRQKAADRRHWVRTETDKICLLLRHVRKLRRKSKSDKSRPSTREQVSLEGVTHRLVAS